MNKTWRRLDNAAKFFPPTNTKRNPHVFRIACEMVETVDVSCLQTALEDTLQRLPYFRSSLKKGFFWYYLEESEADIRVQPDTQAPCSAIYHGDNQAPLFRLTYYRYRINLEVYHALADGIGAFVFFRSLVQEYLIQKYGEAAGGSLQDENIPLDVRQQDDFETNYSPEGRRHGVHGARAYRIRGDKLPEHGLSFIVGRMPLGDVLAKAKENGSTLSEYLVAWLIFAIGQTMPLRKRKRPVVVSVPVDLRRFYASHTMRNFFATFGVAHCFDANGGTFEEILLNVQKDFKDKLNPKALDRQMNQFASLEHNAVAKVTPLFIKILILGISGLVTRSGDSAGFSNLGKVEMPKAAEKYIQAFDVMLSTNRPQLCICSFKDTLSIGFSSPFAGARVPCTFFRALAASDICVGIYTNTPGEVAL